MPGLDQTLLQETGDLAVEKRQEHVAGIDQADRAAEQRHDAGVLTAYRDAADHGEPLRHVMSPYERVRVVDTVAIELEPGRVVGA
jgi:hypothetical protein